MKKTVFRKKLIVLSAVLSMFLFLLMFSGCADKTYLKLSDNTEVTKYSEPGLKDDGSPYTIAFMDEGPPIESSYLWFKGICEEMQRLGYISKDVDLTKAPADLEKYYQYILDSDYGNKVKFCDTLYLITEDNEEELKTTLKKRVDKKEIDLFVVTGTYPGTFLKEMNYGIPFFVSFAADPVASGIIKSPENTGNKDIWALVEPIVYKRQLDVYEDKFGFSKFGMLTGIGCDAKSGIIDIKEEAKKNNLRYSVEYIPEEGATKEEVTDAVKRLIDKKCEVVIVLYGALDSNNVLPSEIVDAIKGKNVPLIISDGEEHVKNGGMMLVAMCDYEAYGTHTMDMVNNVLHGEKAGDQDTVYISTPKVIFNMKTAKKLGFKTKFEFLQQVDVMY